MKKILSLMMFAAILFVASATQAAPYVQVTITDAKVDRQDNTFHLFTTLTNTGDQDAQVYQMNIRYFRILDENGNILVDFQNVEAKIEPCYVHAGYHVDNVEWVIPLNNDVPYYKGNTQVSWDGYIKYDPIR